YAATSDIYTLSLHDALPISLRSFQVLSIWQDPLRVLADAFLRSTNSRMSGQRLRTKDRWHNVHPVVRSPAKSFADKSGPTGQESQLPHQNSLDGDSSREFQKTERPPHRQKVAC